MKLRPLPGLPAIPAKLDPVRRRLERWRGSHKFRCRIPEDIWARAVMLAREYGVGKTSRILRLDYYALKKRLGIADEEHLSKQHSPAFMELISPIPHPLPECIVEFEYPGGAKMRFQFNGKNRPELSKFTDPFGRSEQ